MPNDTTTSSGGENTASKNESTVGLLSVNEQVEEDKNTKETLKKVDTSVDVMMDSTLLEYDLSKDL